jgi:hypothetical protein
VPESPRQSAGSLSAIALTALASLELLNCDYKRNETLDLCERTVLKDLPGGYKLCLGGTVGNAEECMYNCLIEFQRQIGTK